MWTQGEVKHDDILPKLKRHFLQEADLAWKKRQAMVIARESAERRKAIWEMWEPAGGSKHGQKTHQSTETKSTRDRKRSAATAENAARAARRSALSYQIPSLTRRSSRILFFLCLCKLGPWTPFQTIFHQFCVNVDWLWHLSRAFKKPSVFVRSCHLLVRYMPSSGQVHTWYLNFVQTW